MRPLIIFYILVVYVFLSFLWWSYLLLDSNKEIFKYKQELQQQSTSENYYESEDFLQLKTKYNKRIGMIVGEGAVFLVLLIIGFGMVHKSYRKEDFLNQQQKNFLLSITHELKSPLASIKLALETLKKPNLTAENKKVLLANSLEDVKRLDVLLENALLALRFEQKSYQYVNEKIDFSALLQNVLDKMKSVSTDNINIKSSIDTDIYFTGDRQAITSVITNLLENAVKYSFDNAKIFISLSQHDGKTIFSVADNGSGIPIKEKENIFKRFYRIGDESTRKVKGTGLGLYIVEQVVKNYNGKINLKDNDPNGSIFEIILPSRA